MIVDEVVSELTGPWELEGREKAQDSRPQRRGNSLGDVSLAPWASGPNFLPSGANNDMNPLVFTMVAFRTFDCELANAVTGETSQLRMIKYDSSKTR